MKPYSGRCLWSSAFLCVLVLGCLTGCNLQRLTVNQTADVLYAGQPAMERESDPQFAREAMPGSLKTVETFLISSPDNPKLLEILAKGYYSYAFGFLEWDLQQAEFELADEQDIARLRRRAVIHFLRARDYGFQRLDRPQLERAAREGDEEALQAELNKLEREDVPGLFWAAYGWGSAINLSQHDADMVASLSVVEKMMERSIELNEEYFYAGAHLFFGVLYASRPAMFGGDAERARKHFERAMELFGDRNVMIPYLMARYYAPAVQDRALFVSLLTQVVQTDVEAYPELRLNNEIARERARFWLHHIEELIIE